LLPKTPKPLLNFYQIKFKPKVLINHITIKK